MDKKLTRYCRAMDIGNGVLLFFDSLMKTVVRHQKNEFSVNDELKTISLMEDVSYPQYMHGNGLLLDKGVEEYRMVAYQANQAYCNMLSQEDPNIILHLTMSCNFDCSYCYQKSSNTDFRQPCEVGVFMSDETIGRSAKLAERLMHTPKEKVLHLSLFGGEPLFDGKRFLKAVDAFRDLAESKGYRLAVRTTTNGYGLNDDIISHLDRLGLKSLYVGVTIDGTRDVHDSRRPLKGGGRTYDIIMQNIRSLVSGFSNGELDLNIASIVDKDNFESAIELGAMLHRDGLLQKARFMVQPRDLGLNVNVRKAQECGHSCAFTGIESEGVKREFYARMESLTGVFHGRSILAHSLPCRVAAMKGFAVDPVGNVYRCIDDVTNPELIVGHVNDDAISVIGKTMLEYSTARLWDYDDCRRCSLLPVCMPQRCIKFRISGIDCSKDKARMERSLRLDMFEMAGKTGMLGADPTKAIKYSDDLFYLPREP